MQSVSRMKEIPASRCTRPSSLHVDLGSGDKLATACRMARTVTLTVKREFSSRTVRDMPSTPKLVSSSDVQSSQSMLMQRALEVSLGIKEHVSSSNRI
jgi:hypothetical protein